jgi:hypothetical protein
MCGASILLLLCTALIVGILVFSPPFKHTQLRLHKNITPSALSQHQAPKDHAMTTPRNQRQAPSPRDLAPALSVCQFYPECQRQSCPDTHCPDTRCPQHDVSVWAAPSPPISSPLPAGTEHEQCQGSGFTPAAVGIEVDGFADRWILFTLPSLWRLPVESSTGPSPSAAPCSPLDRRRASLTRPSRRRRCQAPCPTSVHARSAALTSWRSSMSTCGCTRFGGRSGRTVHRNCSLR